MARTSVSKTEDAGSTPAAPASDIHFVGFRGEEYWSAVKVWGLPDFYHRGYDLRMRRGHQ